jgi:hypothetical protein
MKVKAERVVVALAGLGQSGGSKEAAEGKQDRRRRALAA